MTDYLPAATPDAADREGTTGSTAGAIDADRVEMRNSAAQSVDADAIEMHNSAAQVVEADTLRMVNSAAAFARTETLAAEQSNLGLLRAADATIADSSVFALAADHIQAANLRAVWLVARQVEGDVKAVLTPASALALGTGLGAAIALVSLLTNRRR